MNSLIVFATTFAPLLAFIGSFITIFMTIQNAKNSRKAVLINAFVNGKLEHIKSLKSHLQEFLQEYISNSNNDIVKLRIVKSKIDTSILGSEDIYLPLSEYLEYCIDNGYSQECYNKLIKLSENVVSDVWDSIKLQTGLQLNNENSLYKQLHDNTLGILINPKKTKKLNKKQSKK
jgi:hypothetical protein